MEEMANLGQKYCVSNIRDNLCKAGEDTSKEQALQMAISRFSCPRNPDIERFLKNSAVEFTKKSQSVTYLVFSREDWELLGYFTLTVKPLTVEASKVSKTVVRKLERVSRLDETSQTYTTAAYLIAQLGKNYTGGADKRISGADLLGLAWDVIQRSQYALGGVIAFVEAEEHEQLLSFYQENGFRQFDRRRSSDTPGEAHGLVQMLRML